LESFPLHFLSHPSTNATMTSTNILQGTVGGLLIGAASSVLLFGAGKVMGISGELVGLLVLFASR
jgi:hypothetical protein